MMMILMTMMMMIMVKIMEDSDEIRGDNHDKIEVEHHVVCSIRKNKQEKTKTKVNKRLREDVDNNNISYINTIY